MFNDIGSKNILSASSITIIAFLPPISSCTFLPLSTQARAMPRPTPTEPVKLMAAIVRGQPDALSRMDINEHKQIYIRHRIINKDGKKIGAVGVSGDTSCADHNIAWRVRGALDLGKVPAGVSPNKDDGVIYDITNGKSAGGFGHPTCGGKEVDVAKEIKAGS